MPREWKVVVPIPLVVVARGRRHYVSSFSAEGAALENISLKEMATKEWSSLLVSEKRSRKYA